MVPRLPPQPLSNLLFTLRLGDNKRAQANAGSSLVRPVLVTPSSDLLAGGSAALLSLAAAATLHVSETISCNF